jgi:hypothetical protein
VNKALSFVQKSSLFVHSDGGHCDRVHHRRNQTLQMVIWSRKEISSRLKKSSQDNCINWRGSPLRSGDNVIFQNKSGGGYLSGQIIDIQDCRDVPPKELFSSFAVPKDKRMWMVLIRHRCMVNSNDCWPPDPMQYCYGPYNMKEVADTLLPEWVLWN